MSYRALLFCADEKESRAVTQVFRELDFYVETSNEPFDAVKRLTGQHYDALVVDCEHEENASLLFKSARNSASNNNSLAVAVVAGQANIAKAFRLGANLVLTKPINLEQAKGTLRVARGLLRKTETGKLSVAPPAESPSETASPAFQKSVLTPLPIEQPAPVASASPQVEKEASPQPDTAEAYLQSLSKTVTAESKPAAAGQAAAAAPAKESRWTSKTEILEPKPVAADDVKKAKKREEVKPAPVAKRAETPGKPATPRFATLGVNKEDESAAPESGSRNFWIAAVIVLALAGGAYFGWTKYHPAIHLPFLSQQDEPAPAPPAVPTPKPPASPSLDATAPTAAADTNAVGAATPDSKPAEPVTSAAPATSAAPGLVKVPDSIAEGLLIKRVDPNYPDQARAQKVEGLVQLRATINRNGDVTAVKALHGNPLLAQAASDAVKQWKYKPYVVNGAPTSIETGITLTFKLP